ncbi:MAG TPA: HAD family hydrolase, partial [Polyangia bacterium]|nr:HAD family hydrolase [Polyangia bacterium]
LLGRFLQQALLERNRNYLLTDDGADGIFVRRVNDDVLQIVPAPRVAAGDRLLIAPGELVPVDAVLQDAAAPVSTDWINGEATPRACAAGATVPAGSFNAGRSAFTAIAQTSFAESPLGPLLRQPSARRQPGARGADTWDRIARRWVVGVLTMAALGLAWWLPRDPHRALDVVVALLVVTCPCGIGIALPLAYELVQTRLRRVGFFTRTTDVLDRMVRVKKVAFDKTGTLTLGGLELANPAALAGLSDEARTVTYNLACRSLHPVAACLATALAKTGARFDSGRTVTEALGSGLALRADDGAEWRLGRPAWTAGPRAVKEDQRGTWLTRDGEPVARFETREVVRPGVAADLRALEADGLEPWLISGDTAARSHALADAVGIAPAHVRAERSPAHKATDVAAMGEGVLYVGDGVNDALAFGTALVAGTVAIERPVLPGRSDFFLVGASLAPIGQALRAARRLRRVVGEVITASLLYNLVVIISGLAGHITPLRAAIAMPLSSLGLIALTMLRLSERRDRPRARFAPSPSATPAEATP